MWSEDIEGSDAYAKALQKTGILTEKETKEICEGLEKVRAEWAAGEFKVVVSTTSRLYRRYGNRLLFVHVQLELGLVCDLARYLLLLLEMIISYKHIIRRSKHPNPRPPLLSCNKQELVNVQVTCARSELVIVPTVSKIIIIPTSSQANHR